MVNYLNGYVWGCLTLCASIWRKQFYVKKIIWTGKYFVNPLLVTYMMFVQSLWENVSMGYIFAHVVWAKYLNSFKNYKHSHMGNRKNIYTFSKSHCETEKKCKTFIGLIIRIWCSYNHYEKTFCASGKYFPNLRNWITRLIIWRIIRKKITIT